MLVLDNQATSSHVNDICFYANIEPYPPVLDRLGPAKFWGFDSDYYCEEDITRPDQQTADLWQREQEEQNHCVVNDRKGTLVIRKVDESNE